MKCRMLAVMATVVVTQMAAAADEAYVPLLENDAAWRVLPTCAEGAGTPLPNWARALAETLPTTTAAILELDGVYRLSEEIDPGLRAKMRWVAARGTRSAYGQSYALADLGGAGVAESEIESLQGDWQSLPARQRRALNFAHKMTVAAHSVTDEEVAALIRDYGEPQVVAMVLQLAYSNFLDRLVLALGVPLEDGGPLPPQTYGFEVLSELPRITPASRPEFAALADDGSLDMDAAFGADWLSVTFADLQQAMLNQQERPGRISVPEESVVRAKLPEGMYPANRPMKIKWSLVVLGHQPQLGPTWLRCLRVFGAESQFDRVFEESIFWVVTRSLQCFY